MHSKTVLSKTQKVTITWICSFIYALGLHQLHAMTAFQESQSVATLNVLPLETALESWHLWREMFFLLRNVFWNARTMISAKSGPMTHLSTAVISRKTALPSIQLVKHVRLDGEIVVSNLNWG